MSYTYKKNELWSKLIRKNSSLIKKTSTSKIKMFYSQSYYQNSSTTDSDREIEEREKKLKGWGDREKKDKGLV